MRNLVYQVYVFAWLDDMDWTAIKFDWNRARAFLVTAEQGSFSAGARALGLTQPTLGRQVAALEQELGVTLFERVGQGLVLTESGRAMVHHVRAMGDAATQLSMAASGQASTLDGTVSITTSELEAVFLLPPVLAQLRQRYPGIHLDIQVTHEVANLTRREADIALRSFRPKQPDLIARKLYDDPIWLYGTPQYLAPFGNPTSVDELNSIQLIGFDREHQLLSVLGEQGWPLDTSNIRLTTLSLSLQWELVKRHQGLAFIPQTVGDREPLFRRAFEQFGPPLVLPLWLVCHRELHTSQRIRVVFDAIAEALTGKESGL